MRYQKIVSLILLAFILTGCAQKLTRETVATESAMHRVITETQYDNTGAVTAVTKIVEDSQTNMVSETKQEVKPNDSRIAWNIALFCIFILALFGVIALIIWRVKK